MGCLPGILRECASLWSLQLGEPYAYAFASLAMPVRCADGMDAVLKVQFPDRESAREAPALERWDGNGAVRLLAHDLERHALLLERCEPGRPLSELAVDDALDVMVGLLPRLWIPAGGQFRPLMDEAADWTRDLQARWERAGRPFSRAAFDEALETLGSLPGSQGEQVLVSQDQHAGNVLSAAREPWLVIDPKPLVGEREFGVVALVRGSELGHSEAAMLHRLDRLAGELGLDRDRARRWTLAQTVAWALEEDEFGEPSPPDARLVEVVGWLLDA